jgi:single-strand DNA-binding protein
VRYSADGKPVVSFRVASNFRKRDAETREWVDATNWYRVTTFGRLAERLSEQASAGRLTKGARIVVFGRLEASAYTDRNNQPQPSLDLIADDVLYGDNRPRGEGEGGALEYEGTPQTARPAPQGRPPADDAADLEDLPF